MNDEQNVEAQAPPNQDGLDEFLEYISSRQAARQAKLPSVLNLPDGAYLAVAIVAAAGIIAWSWGPAQLPIGWVLMPTVLLVAGFAMKGVFGALMLYEGWLRWRQERKDRDWP